MFCVIASYDTVVSHSPCKLRVSIHKNKIEAGNWLSRVREREKGLRGRDCFHQRKASEGVFPLQHGMTWSLGKLSTRAKMERHRA